MKPLSKFLPVKSLLVATSLSVVALAGCAIVPAEPGYVYAAPPPPVAATVVVRPAYRPHYGYRPYWRRW